MKIEVYIMAYNEEKIISYLIRHYSQFAKIIFIESNSTDHTIELAQSLGAEVRQVEMLDELSDQTNIDIKNECWKGTDADWVMIIDADEFVYHTDIVSVLEKTDATIIQPTFHNMFSELFPTTAGQIYDEVNMGTEDGGIWHSKPLIFNPRKIQSINFHPGGHYASPVGEVKYSYDSGIKILHMRFLSREYCLERYFNRANRISQENKNNGWGIQYSWGKKEIDDLFNNTNLIKVI